MSFLIADILKVRDSSKKTTEQVYQCEIKRPTPIKNVNSFDLNHNVVDKMDNKKQQVKTAIHYMENERYNFSDINSSLWTYPFYLNLNNNNHYIPIPFSSSTKRKGGQIRFTANQTEILEKKFHSHKYLSPDDRKNLAEILQLSDRQIKTWFQNRRAKWRRIHQLTLQQHGTSNS